MAKQMTRRKLRRYAKKAKKHGVPHAMAVNIAFETNDAGLPLALGYALFEQESGYRNVFGHDPTSSIPRQWMGTVVTAAKYAVYKANRKLGRGMQGVGPGQLTWWETQDTADRMGGCHIPKINIRVSLLTLAARIKENGLVKGIERYNGSGPAAVQYSREVRARAARWQRILSAR